MAIQMRNYELYNYLTGKFTGIQKSMLEYIAIEINIAIITCDQLWIEVVK